jgi:hypothetical protein
MKSEIKMGSIISPACKKSAVYEVINISTIDSETILVCQRVRKCKGYPRTDSKQLLKFMLSESSFVTQRDETSKEPPSPSKTSEKTTSQVVVDDGFFQSPGPEQQTEVRNKNPLKMLLGGLPNLRK